MSAICSQCQATVDGSDSRCPQCGNRIASGTTTYAADPLMAAPAREHRSRRKKRPWYRQKLIIACAFISSLMVMSVVGAGIYIDRQFGEMNRISTPPSSISGRILDDDATVDVDTDPARQVLAIAESGQTGQFTLTNSGDTTNPDVSGTPSGTTDASIGRFTLRPVLGSSGSTNILLMGVDACSGDAIDIGVRPDSLSVLHLDNDSGSCRILALPRDTRTWLPGYGESKINHALAVGGVPYEMLVVEQLLGIEIDHYGLIDFSGTEGLVDAVDGVTVNNPKAFASGGYTYAEGEIDLDGGEAVRYARFRYDGAGDFGRIERQQQIIRALLSQTSGMDVALGAPKLLTAVDGHIRTDLSPTQMMNLATDYRSNCTASTLETSNLEGSIETHTDPLLNLDLSYVIVDPREVEVKVAWLLAGM